MSGTLDHVHSDLPAFWRTERGYNYSQMAHQGRVPLQIRAQNTDHRLKNFVPVVLAIIKLSGQTCSTVSEFQTTLEGRLRALGGATALIGGSQIGVDIRELLKVELSPFLRRGQLRMVGPRLRLSPLRAEAYAMLIHELGTNAIKHGALSVSEGSVTVTWERSRENQFTFQWAERNGPPVRAPKKHGFGSVLLGIDDHPIVGGKACLDFAAEGFRYTLVAALSNNGQ